MICKLQYRRLSLFAYFLFANSLIHIGKNDPKLQFSSQKRPFYLRLAVQNDGTYLPRITRETCTLFAGVTFQSYLKSANSKTTTTLCFSKAKTLFFSLYLRFSPVFCGSRIFEAACYNSDFELREKFDFFRALKKFRNR